MTWEPDDTSDEDWLPPGLPEEVDLGMYILDEMKNPVKVYNARTWGEWLESNSRILAQDTLPDGKIVSTVFLALDHGLFTGRFELWETMVFPSAHNFLDIEMQRYSTYIDATIGHVAMVAKYSNPLVEDK